MDLKIFPIGFDVVEFNKFCKENIIIQYKLSTDNSGQWTAYVFYKPATSIGITEIDRVEILHIKLCELQKMMIQVNIDLEEERTKLADLNEEISRIEPNNKNWDSLQNLHRQTEDRIFMHEKTLSGTKKQESLILDALKFKTV